MAQKFLATKRLALNFLGEAWNECYIDLIPYGAKELKAAIEAEDRAADATISEVKRSIGAIERKIEELKSAFVAGKGVTAAGIIDLKAEDLEHLPVEVFTKANNVLLGPVDPNSQAPSTN